MEQAPIEGVEKFLVSNVTAYSRLSNKRAGRSDFFHLSHEKNAGAKKKSISEAPRLLDS